MNQAEVSSQKKTFFNVMQEEIKIVSNIQFILEKLNQENLFNGLQDIFNKILNNEIVFAIKGISLTLRTQKNRETNQEFRHKASNHLQHLHFQRELKNNFHTYR